MTSKNGINFIFSTSKTKLFQSEVKLPSDYLDLITDLKNTLEINQNILKSKIPQVFESSEEIDVLTNILKNIENLYDKKNNIRDQISLIKGKNLLNSLIEADHKRKTEESISHAKNQINDLNEVLEEKIENRKSIEKKLKEYEKYIIKHSKLSTEDRYNYLRSYDIMNFTEKNTEMVEQIEEYNNSIKTYNMFIHQLREEIESKKEENSETNNLNNTSGSIKLKDENKVKRIIIHLINKRKNIETKISHLKKQRDNLSKIIRSQTGYKNKNDVDKSLIVQKNPSVGLDHTLYNKMDVTDYNDLLGNNTRVDIQNISKVLPKDILDITVIPKK